MASENDLDAMQEILLKLTQSVGMLAEHATSATNHLTAQQALITLLARIVIEHAGIAPRDLLKEIAEAIDAPDAVEIARRVLNAPPLLRVVPATNKDKMTGPVTKGDRQ